MGVWMLLFACAQPPNQTHPEAPGAAENDPRQLAPVPLPAELPFTARSRMSPVTLVDERGQVVLVLSAIGVELEVERALADRALVRCTGCREPVEAWIQRAALFAGTTAAGGPMDDLLAFAATLQDPAVLAIARHGFVREPSLADAYVAPPWWSEGGYAGDTVVLRRSPQGWTAELRPAEPPKEP